MALTPEQIKELKNQLSEQIQHLPEDQKAEAQKQIDSMSPEALESMLKQQQAQQQPIFRSIVSGEIPSKVIDQNPDFIAVLSVKSLSKGHTIVIPKTAVTKEEDLPKTVESFTQKLAKKITSKLKAKGCEIKTQPAFGELIINIIPVYNKPLDPNAPPIDATEEELQDLYSKLKDKPKPEVIKVKKKRTKTIKLSRRIP